MQAHESERRARRPPAGDRAPHVVDPSGTEEEQAPAAVPTQLLRLQSSAGNRAVTGMVTVQRHSPGPDTVDAPAKPIGTPAVKQVIQQGVAAGGVTEGGEEHGTAAPPEATQAPAPAPVRSGGGLLGALGRGLRSIGSGVMAGARAVGGAVSAGARAVGSAISSGARAVGGAVSSLTDTVRRAIAKARISIDIRAHGAPGADQARTYIDEIFMSSSIDNLESMAGKTIEFNIIPVGTKLTELDEFKSLAGQMTFDGRLWDDVRGIWMGAGPKTIRFAVGAEDLGAGGSGYGPGFVAAHEGGHGLQNHGLTDTQKAAITKAYQDRLAAHPVTRATPATDPAQDFWLQPEWYSAANENEYFASSVAAWFGHPYNTGAAATARYTREWLRTNDRPMYDILSSIYGR